MKAVRAVLLVPWFLCVGCCSCPPAAAPPPKPPPPEVVEEPAPAPEPAEEVAEQPEESKPEESKPAAAEPEFKAGMSVNEAINAVPVGAERLNLDPDVLGAPVSNMKVYEPCKPRPNEHAKIRVAVWDGKAVGVDVHVTPNNPRLAECIKEQVRSLTWRDKVRSLNTVDFAF